MHHLPDTPRTPHELEEIRRQYAARRRRQIVLAVPVVITILIAFLVKARVDLSRFGFPVAAFGPVFFGFVVVALVFSFINWRCPACNGYLGRDLNPRFCAKCGVALR